MADLTEAEVRALAQALELLLTDEDAVEVTHRLNAFIDMMLRTYATIPLALALLFSTTQFGAAQNTVTPEKFKRRSRPRCGGRRRIVAGHTRAENHHHSGGRISGSPSSNPISGSAEGFGSASGSGALAAWPAGHGARGAGRSGSGPARAT